MNVGELRRALEEAESILAAAKTPTKDLRAFLEVFADRDHEDIDVFFDELRRRLSIATDAADTHQRVPDTALIERYVRGLNDAGTDKASFATLYAQLKKDRAVQKEEADAIAHQFTGGRRNWPSRGEALAAVQDWFDHKAYQAVKMLQVDKGTAWKSKRG
jgi:hypothetical protein